MIVKSAMDPVQRGVMLREELDDLGLAASALAEAIDVHASRVAAVLNGERGIAGDTALHLGGCFDTTPRFRLDLQQTWQDRLAETKAEAVRAVARRTKATADKTVSTLKALAGNLAWCDQLRTVAPYRGLGFDANLTDLPMAAFREAVELADIRSERPSLVESYGPPVPSPAANEEAAFARTNEAHDWLQRFESHLRRFIDVEMARQFGAEWPRHRLPHGMYHKWKAKQDAAARERRPQRPLVAYADFTDYSRIIMRKDNWRQVFASYFGRPENVRESFQRLHPIRRDAMHARLISQDDELLLYVEVKRIMRAIES